MFRITLEPVSFFVCFGIALIMGAEVSTNMLLHKICVQELNYSQRICDNLNKSSDIFNEIQKKGNNFLMVSGWIESAPALVYSLFVGSLADQFGFKPLLLGPLTGMLISDIAMLFNCIFIDVLPLEIFYFERAWAIFGGGAVFYLGVYGYGTSITEPNSRASTLGRIDGFEVIGKISGTLMSPVILNQLSATYSYSFKICCTVMALIYVALMVKTPPNKPMTKMKKNFKSIDLFTPLFDMVKTLFTKRPKKLHWILLVQFSMYAIYCASYEEELLRYLFLQKSFGFTGTDFAYLTVFITSINSIGLLVILPILSQLLKFHDATIQTISITVESLGIFAFAFSATLTQAYLSNGIMELMAFLKYGLIRSLMSKCVQSDEIGKIFSALALSRSAFALIGSLAYRQLYNATLDTFPASEILMKGILYFFGSLVSFTLYLQKWRIDEWRTSPEIPQIQYDEYKISHL